jgi:amino acid adenylation domain-containing protein
LTAGLRVRIAEIAKQTPYAPALLACGKNPASYEKLLRQIDETARRLALKGIGRADRVAVVMPNGPEMASLFLGVASVAAFAPLNPTYRANEFDFYLSDLHPKLVIVDAATESAVRDVARAKKIGIVELRSCELGEAGSFALGPAFSEAIPDVPVEYSTTNDVALVLHTSGTTSRPKIVPLTHENLCVSAVNIAESLALTPSDRCLNIMPLFHVHGLVGAVLSTLSVGASVVCAPGYKATEFFEWLAEFQPTWYTGVPTMHHGILAHAKANRAIIAAHPLRFIRSCSASLAPQIMAQLEEVFGAPVLEAYGMTEAAHQISCNGLPPQPRKPGSVGHPTGVDVAIMDNAGALLPAGTEGEVVIRGHNVTRGYENNSDANLKSFTGGWFRTGDQGRFDNDGDLFLTGRIKELIVRGGEKIPPREIDEALLSHSAVAQALAFALPDLALGEKVAAAVVLKAGASASELELCEHVAASLAGFKVPEKIVFLTEIPKGPTGKPQRIGLAEKLGLSGQAEQQIVPAIEYCAPRCDTENRLAEMWRAVLKLEHAGIRDNFFDAGGDSILAGQLIARIQQVFRVELSAPRLFQFPTIAELAEFIERQAGRKTASLNLLSVSRTGGVLLTSAQQRMWFLAKLEPDTPLYNRPSAYRVKGSLDLFRLQQSLSAVEHRHEILRTNYYERDGVATGVVREAGPVPVALVDLSRQPAAERESAATQWMRQEAARPFHLETDRIWRCALARLAPDEHILLLVMHHIACDASTETVIVADLASAYNGVLPDAPAAQYADYAAWQHSRQSAAREEELAWWKQQLAGMANPCQIPGDFERPQHDRYRGSSVVIQVDSATIARCKALARAGNTTLFSVLLAAFEVLLNRYTGSEDIVVGTPVAVRNHPATESMAGLFINTLTLRTSAAGNPTFREFMLRVRETVNGGLAHQEVPFEAVLNALRPEHNVGLSAPFQAMFEYRNIDKPHLAMEGVVAERIEFDRGIVPFDLTLDIEPIDGGLRGYFYYNAGLFERSTIEGLARHFVTLLECAVQSPGEKLSRLRLIPPEEQAQVLAWGQNNTPFPDVYAHQLFEEQADKAPDAIALVFEGASVSYSELNLRANKLAHLLEELGVKPGVRVAICVERGFEMIMAVLAVLKAGGAYVPLDPACPTERLRFMLADSAPVALLIQSHLEGLFSGIGNSPATIDLTDAFAALRHQAESNPNSRALGLKPDHLAYLIYTSGSTGAPKGVMVQHAELSNLVNAQINAFDVEPCSRILQFSSFSFDASVFEIMMALCRGASLHLIRKAEILDCDSLIRILVEHRITHATLPPAVLAGLPNHASLDSVRTLIVAGDVLSEVAANSWVGGRRLINAYGPTEATVCTTLHDCQARQRGTPPIGRPIANARVYILDSEGQPVPVGVTGELYAGGAGVARGYLNRPGLTAAKFLADPFASESGRRMYRTGDLGSWRADGNIEFLGRNDSQVKIRGYRIELGEIEAQLAACQGVRDAVVIAREDAPTGKHLVAYYTSSGNVGTPVAEELRTRLSERLPEYMVPVAYVHLEKLPLNLNGKLNRKALPAPDVRTCPASEYTPPQSGIEASLAATWAEILHLEKVGKNDNFFDLGGHSLLVLRLVARLREKLHVKMEVRDLFEHPVLEDLARFLDPAAPFQLPPIVPVDRTKGTPLSFAQQRLWFLAQIEGVSEAYYIPTGFRLTGKLNREALRSALDCMLSRQEALRAVFILIDGEPVQRFASAADCWFQLVEHDLRHQSEPRKELDRLSALEAHAPFDLEQGPLIRGRLIRLADEEHALLITVHHIVSDGWSIGVLVNELNALYGAFLRGEPNPLPELKIQYADYAVWQRRWVEGELLRQQGDYWRTTLAGVPALLALPSDHPHPDCQDYSGAYVGVVLDEQLTSGLKKLSRRHSATTYMILLAGWALMMERLSGQMDFVIGSPAANRGCPETENLIGLFANILAIRLDLSGSPSVGELIERVKTQTLAAQQHQDIPFEQIVDLAQPARSLAFNPLFQVMFSWQNASASALELPGLEIQPLPAPPRTTSKFDLSLYLQENGQTIVGGLEYATSLFEEDTIRRYLGYFRTLLGAMIVDDTRPAGSLPMLFEIERNRILCEWNDTGAGFPHDKCVHELFEEQVLKTPVAPAVVFENASLSYVELNIKANRLAHYLRELGVQSDARVAICLERRLEMIVALLAVLKAGGAYMPLDPTYPIERLRFMFEDSGPVALITQRHYRQSFIGLSDSLPILDMTSTPFPWNGRSDANLDCASIGLTPDHLAYVIFTSGSTGTPKGVAVEHRNAVNLIHWARSSFGADILRSTLFSTSLSFDLAVFECFVPITSGATVRIVQNALALEPATADVTLINTVPSAMDALIQADKVTSTVRTINLAGEVLKPTLVERIFSTTAVNTVCNLYGPSETSVYSTWVVMRRGEAFVSHIGRPIANTRIYVLDAHRQPVPVGVVGELYIGGVGVARGYLNRPELTAEKFLTDPFSPELGARMYRTGDLGKWLADGNVEFLGRNDSQVKIHGFRIELGEIEARLASCPGVRDAAVIASEDARGDKGLIAYYTSSEEEAPSPRALRLHLSTTLPTYMVPAAYVRLKMLPQTANGKIDRTALSLPDADARPAGTYEPPQGGIESSLASIWAEVLDVEHVGKNDNFFDLGGHSLLIAKLLARVKRDLDMYVPMATIFQHSTLHEFSNALAGRMRTIHSQREISSLGPLLWVGGGFYLQEIAAELRPECEVCPVWPQDGFMDASSPPLSLHDIARKLADLIRKRYPEGPYIIGGYCSEGVVAYETAQQLQGMGCDVALLVIVEAFNPSITSIGRLTSRLRKELYHLYELVSAPSKGWSGYLVRVLDGISLRYKDWRYKRRSNRLAGEPMERNVDQILRVAIRQYNPRCYAGRVACFQAEDRSWLQYKHPDKGWRPLVGKESEFYEVPGDHLTMMDAAHVKALARQLRKTILKISAEGNRHDAGGFGTKWRECSRDELANEPRDNPA